MGKLRQLPDGLHRVSPKLGYLAPQTRNEQSRDRDRRLAWRSWYKTARWQRLRWSVLLRDNFTCQMCGDVRSDTSQLVADHTIRHGGDPLLFWDDQNLQCLCAPCHNSEKQRAERAER
ncbi:HNH endonuclease [Sulfitobacter pontiacus]|uniref:HNH endonuclease n=1 Tax=Sulfitobacter pontiacus TaxID=60137 RepID=UPI002773FDC7|nr:HNH endonuclease [Sulfitobacter pontiacus]GLO78503.1 hypothetical protein MACH23_19240 [Sulfitobacter pontiacus]